MMSSLHDSNRTLRGLALVLIPLSWLTACTSTTDTSGSCRTVANCLFDSAPICDAATLSCRACTMGADDNACKNGRPATPRCGPQGSCVACITNSDCASRDLRKPTCRSNACTSCRTSIDCQSKLCSADGSCAPVSEVLYVDNKNGGCTGSDHRGSIDDAFCTLQDALAAVTSGGKTRISVAPSSKAYAALKLTGTDTLTSLTIAGGGGRPTDTRIEGASGESAIAVIGGTSKLSVAVRNVELQGGSGKAGITCEMGAELSVSGVRIHDSGTDGIFANGCTLSVDSSQLFANKASGLLISGSTYSLSNLMIWNNTIVGIAFGGSSSGTMRFLTVYGNGTQTGSATPGIDCGASPLLVEHSIVFDNLLRASGGNISLDQQLTGCMLSNVVTNDKVVSGSIYKTAVDFVQPAGDTASIDLHLIKDSPKNRDCCVDKVQQSPVSYDFDGTSRPQGPAADVGAHEVQ